MVPTLLYGANIIIRNQHYYMVPTYYIRPRYQSLTEEIAATSIPLYMNWKFILSFIILDQETNIQQKNRGYIRPPPHQFKAHSTLGLSLDADFVTFD